MRPRGFNAFPAAAWAPGFVAAVAITDMMFATALPPLLPGIEDGYALTAVGVGLLVASHTIGSFAGGVVTLALISRAGARPFVIGGMALSAAACAAFAVAGDPWALGLARTVHGLGSSMAWVGALTWLVARGETRNRRGSLVGGTIGAMWLGGAIGPVLGGIGASQGLFVPFALLALAKGGLCLVAHRFVADAPAVTARKLIERGKVWSAHVFGGVAFYAVPSLFLGVLAVLAPLELSLRGWSSTGIAGIYAVGAVVQAVAGPLVGRWFDRAALPTPLAAALGASAIASILLAAPWLAGQAVTAALVVAALTAYSLSMTPALALLSAGFEALDRSAGAGFALGILVWSPAAVVGSVGGAGIAAATSQTTVYLALAGVACAALAGVRVLGQRTRIDTSTACAVSCAEGGKA